MEHLISVEASQAFGLVGVITYLLSYGLLQFGIVGGNSYAYALMNAGAAVLVLVSLSHAFNLASALIQCSFIVLSLFGMARVLLATRLARFSKEETAFLHAKVPDLQPHLARKLLDAGDWVDVDSGTSLADQGKLLNHLTFLANGEAQICVDDHFIGKRQGPTFIGELSFFSGTPATASVAAAVQSRCLVLCATALKKKMQRYPEIRMALAASFSENTRETLLIRTAEIADIQKAAQN